MKHCPKCGRDFPDKYRFCQYDRTGLIEVAGDSLNAAPQAATITVETGAPTIPDAPAVAQTAKPKGRKTVILAGIGAVVLVVVLVVIYFAFLAFSAKKAVLAEVQKGNLVKPQGSSAYDVYLKHKDDGLSRQDIDEITAEVSGLLEKRTGEIITNVKGDQIESEDDWTEAIRSYSWLNEIQPSSSTQARLHLAEGRLALLRKDYPNALTSLQKSLARENSFALTLNSIGRVYLAVQDRTTAQEYYRRATVAEPQWLWPWINLGAISNDLKDYATAEPALRQAIQLNYQKASSHNLLGQTLESTNRPCEALSEYQIALDSATTNPTATVNVDALRRKISTISSSGVVCGQ